MKNKIIVGKIISYIDKIFAYTDNMNYDDFADNILVVDACVFNLSQIGELSNKLDSNFENEYDNIPWRILYGLRNRIVHDYEGVNLALVWDIIADDLPDLRKDLQTIYDSI
ncbi:MAG: DUF86 domain-containing protein [Clostridia bacterium]|nr:DUF86 domain-containing protein [Clostridia bacterium]